jgi:DNA polymerase III alpha subunit
MKFTSIKEVIEKTGANAKAAECLGKSGAFNTLEEDLNEIEAAEYARNLVSFLREQEKYQKQLEKYEETIRTKEEKFREAVEERRRKQEVRETKYQERLTKYKARMDKVTSENIKRATEGKTLLKEPVKPAELKYLKEISYPKMPVKPTAPTKLTKPRIVLSTRERIRLQREMLRIYISGHPLDEVPEDEKITKIRNLAESDTSAWIKIRGVLQGVKTTQTRTKKMMGRLRIEDKTGSIEVVAFPRVYESFKEVLVEGELYEILGRVDLVRRELDNGEESIHTQFIGSKAKRIRVGSDKEWDIMYPLLKGNLHILPGKLQKSKGLATTIIINKARKVTEENIGSLR